MGKKRQKAKKHGTKRNAKVTRAIKEELYSKYGHRCWLCGNERRKQDLTLHHIVKFCICKDTTIVNSMILCKHCHFEVVNFVPYGPYQYIEYMRQALEWKRDNEL
jgi:hypothetical protein